MDRELEVTGWKEQWLSRDYQPLFQETIVATYAITITSLSVSLWQLWKLRQARKSIEQGSDRALVLAQNQKTTNKALNAQRNLSWVLLCHSMAIWVVDSGIGIMAIKSDVDAEPSAYTSRTWLNLAIYCIGLFTLFTSVLVVAPTIQFIAIGKLLRYRKPDATSMATFLPAALGVSHQMAYLWFLVGFAMVAWWSVFDYSLLRVVSLEAVFGSALAWMHVSTMLLRCSDDVAEMDANFSGLKAGIGRVYFRSNVQETSLPKYEDEKTSLL